MWVDFRCKFLAEMGQFYARINTPARVYAKSAVVIPFRTGTE